MRVSVRDGRHFREDNNGDDEATSAPKKMRSSGDAYGWSKPRAAPPKRNRHHFCNYLKPGALAQIRDAQLQKRKRALEADSVLLIGPVPQQHQHHHHQQEHQQPQQQPIGHRRLSPEGVPGIASQAFGPACLQRKKLLAPKFASPRTRVPDPPRPEENEATTATPVHRGGEDPPVVGMEQEVEDDVVQSTPEPLERMVTPTGTGSLLESLPLELMVRIVCRLNHNELKPLFHVCKALRYAVVVARQCHFNFKTPGKAVELPNQTYDPVFLPFLSEFPAAGMRQLVTPNAPKHAVKAPKPRISMEEMRQIAATLFQGPLSSAANRDRSSRLTSRAGASHRALFNEEELCQAIAQNTL